MTNDPRSRPLATYSSAIVGSREESDVDSAPAVSELTVPETEPRLELMSAVVDGLSVFEGKTGGATPDEVTASTIPLLALRMSVLDGRAGAVSTRAFPALEALANVLVADWLERTGSGDTVLADVGNAVPVIPLGSRASFELAAAVDPELSKAEDIEGQLDDAAALAGLVTAFSDGPLPSATPSISVRQYEMAGSEIKVRQLMVITPIELDYELPSRRGDKVVRYGVAACTYASWVVIVSDIIRVTGGRSVSVASADEMITVTALDGSTAGGTNGLAEAGSGGLAVTVEAEDDDKSDTRANSVLEEVTVAESVSVPSGVDVTASAGLGAGSRSGMALDDATMEAVTAGIDTVEGTASLTAFEPAAKSACRRRSDRGHSRVRGE
jgi:hypothetical protein